VVQQPDGQLPAQAVTGTHAGIQFAFQRLQRGPYLGVLAQHDEYRRGEPGFGFAQQREQELLLQVDVPAQRGDRAREWLPAAGLGGERRDARVDLVMLSLQRRRQRDGLHVCLPLP
jgi:hypothetical protein